MGQNLNFIGKQCLQKLSTDIYTQKMNKLIKKKLIRFYLWTGLGYFLFAALGMLGNYPDQLIFLSINSLWGVIYVMVFNFILFEYCLPFVIRERKYVIYNILFALLLAAIYLLLYSYGSYAWRLTGEKLGIYTFIHTYETLRGYLGFQLIYNGISIVVFGIGRHLYGYLDLVQSSQQLRIAMQTAELNYLKSQTNPHFLFNTLNNIYSLASDKSDQAPEAVYRLSEILRFMLYETGEPKIPVEQEVRIIKDYVELERLRYDQSLKVDFNYEIQDMNQLLPPLLMLPLVENAFKHGASETISFPYVYIHLVVNNEQLELTVKNSMEKLQVEHSTKKSIGLFNLKRQLELLYPDHELRTETGKNDFTAVLKIRFNHYG